MRFNRYIRNLIADFRSLPRENTYSIPRKPKMLGMIVGAALDNFMIKHRGEHVLLENWCAVVGEKLCKRCRPTMILANDVLLINCDNGVIRSELVMLKSEIFEKITTFPECERIRDIRFSISNGHRDSKNRFLQKNQ